MDQSTPDPQPAASVPLQPAPATPEAESRQAGTVLDSASPTPPAERAEPPVAMPRRMSAARRRALRRRRQRVRWGLFLVLLASVLFIGPGQQDWFNAAAAARSVWRYDRALKFYQVAMRRDPADPRPYCLTGEVLALQREYPSAIAAYRRCRSLGADTAAVALALGDLASARGDSAAAQREWQRSIDRGGMTAHRRLALWFESRSQFDLAAAQWTAFGPRDGQAEEHLGMLALRKLDFAGGQRHFLAARELPGFFGQDAVDADFVQLAALGANSPNITTAVGVAFVRANLPLFARQPLEKAVATTPDDATAHAYLAWVELVAGQQDAASAQASLALDLAPADSFALFVAASVESERGQWSAAVDDCFIAIQSDDKNPALWLLLAHAQESERVYLDAGLSYERAAALGSEPEYTVQLLSFYVGRRLGLTDGSAYAAAVRGESRWPANAPIRKLEGQIDDLLGQDGKSNDSWTAALRLDPTDPEPWYVLGHAAFVGGDFDTAVLYLRTAAALQPGSEWATRAHVLLAPLPTAAI
jgi:tetratricopeptide (TPR) repeat protein